MGGPAGGPLLAKSFPHADVRVVTFASPRVGNKAFAAAFESLIGTTLRFHFNYDPVPCMPIGLRCAFVSLRFSTLSQLKARE